ncbi:hypothetical protein [Mesorhizobium sp. SP-1A]|uniref:hypothetical protein n=1 Tax=Mesorhizobium sp. SP-1A TaxID=3077840 RepID=UPI0028F6C3B0|nr:hypothetical protein [Mesorhizobium sp. SP-1A]
MPEVSQYNFSLKEVGTALLKSAGIAEGKWAVGVNVGLNVGNMGPSPEQAVPSVMVQIQAFNLALVPDETPTGDAILDASKIR